MNINFNSIRDTYGEDILNVIRDNIDDITENINYLRKLNFSDIEDIFERYVLIFIDSPSCFKEKIDKLILKLGSNYDELIGNDLSIFEELL